MEIEQNKEFQLGSDLYEAQVLYANIEKNEIDQEAIKLIIIKYCKLINLTGMLYSDYLSLLNKHEQVKSIFQRN